MEMERQQEELTNLFSRNLSLHNNTFTEPLRPQAPIHQTTKPEEAITYSITQHYHHSAHLAQKPSRPASDSGVTDQKTTEIILSRHGVDVATLFPSQIELFKTADPTQQMRLVELWRISPPNYGGHALAQDLGTWPATSFKQEEAMAKLRYERQMLDERASRTQLAEDHQQHLDGAEDMMSDGEQSNAPMTPIQGGDGRWYGSNDIGHEPEPYMVSGYEMLAQKEYDLSARQPSKDVYSHFGTAVGGPTYNQSTDPVYKSIGDIHQHSCISEDWVHRSQQQQQAIENQYGAFAQNQQYGSGVMIGGFEDDEML
jgi:hypothetical protein